MLDKTYLPAEVEAKHYGAWEESGAFAAGVRGGAKPYTIMMPPPNVTGSLHMGHALNHTLQDILIRYHRLRDRDALWQPGTDHAGIATQMVVERQLDEEGKSRHDLGREGFIDRVWSWKQESGGAITRQLRRLGASPDWMRERFTMDEGLSDAVVKVFVELHNQGLIYRDKRLVNWDPKLHTAISDLEVEQRETTGSMWHFKYPIEGADNQYITVATTRPETMLGDSGIAVHPEDERYAELVGKSCVLPIVGRTIPIVADEYADPEKGSGAVKITPAHDFNDFEVGRRHDLELHNIFDADAQLNETVPGAYRGLDRFEARHKVVAEMEALGLLAGTEENPMVIPYGDRSGVVIEPWLTDQWYVDAATLAGPAIEAVEKGKTKFVPAHWENTYFEWMRNIQPWCISRQIWWGHRIPAWYGPDGEVFVAADEDQAQAAADAHYGKPSEITRDPDVLDTWFSSALWPFSTLGWPQETAELDTYYPTDVLVTGFDIIFFWVARMMMMGLHFMDEAPFHTVYIHALVRDEKGQKMSKSKGNVIDPLELIDQYGADALRFTLTALAAQGRDVRLSASRVEGYRNFATKLWNAARYCQINGCAPHAGFDPASCTLTVNRWIAGGVAALADDVTAAIEAYRFNDAASHLYQFIWGSFCDWYLEFTKPVLTGEDAAAKAETQAAAGWVLDQLLHLLHPIMPFITEELWEKMSPNREGRLITARWPEFSDDLTDPAIEAEMDWVIRCVTAIRAVRSEMNVPPAARIPLIVGNAGEATRARLEIHGDVISVMARLDGITFGDDVPKGALQIVLDEATLALPLAGIIDVAAEKARLEKEIAHQKDEVSRFDKKLANKKFIAKAPSEVVAEQREKREAAMGELDKLGQALQRLEAL
ncbi:MAG: valine--tRNA ligase [Alphaproteobacteria bacterium]|nr:valine--tRNA ligase [Alphaproteobacteria bacterium]